MRSNKSVYVFLALILGIFAGALSLSLSPSPSSSARDFTWALNIARDIYQNRDPYDFVPDPKRIPYPLPAMFFGFPLLTLEPDVAGSVFAGVSVGLLSLGHFYYGRWWFPIFLLSFPVLEALKWCQWSPLIAASWFFPFLGPPLILIKPQIAIPVTLSKRISIFGVMISVVMLLVSLAVYPSWPIRWLGMLKEYESIIPVLKPWGGLLILSSLFLHRPEARLIFLMSVFPFRGAYDLTPWFLVASSPVEALFLVILSLFWINDGMPLFIGSLLILVFHLLRR